MIWHPTTHLSARGSQSLGREFFREAVQLAAREQEPQFKKGKDCDEKHADQHRQESEVGKPEC